MKRAVLLTKTGAMTEVSFCRARENVGCKRYMRRIFWRSHRKEASKVILEGLADDDVPDTFEAWRADEEAMDEINALLMRDTYYKGRANALQVLMESLQDELWELNNARERIHDRIYDLTPRALLCA
jgi:hypothetical protein